MTLFVTKGVAVQAAGHSQFAHRHMLLRPAAAGKDVASLQDLPHKPNRRGQAAIRLCPVDGRLDNGQHIAVNVHPDRLTGAQAGGKEAVAKINGHDTFRRKVIMGLLQRPHPAGLAKRNVTVNEFILPGRGHGESGPRLAGRPGTQANLMAIIQQRLQKLPGTVMGRLDFGFAH
jgi:hypothetical protein